MRVAYLSAADPTNRRAFSGVNFNMMDALRRQGVDVVPMGPVKSRVLRAARLANGASKLLFGRRWAWRYSRLASRTYARALGPRVAASGADLVFAPATFPELAGLDVRAPIVYASDATFTLLHSMYSGYSGLWAWSEREANDLERCAIAKSQALMYSSQWAAQSAVTDYGADPKRIQIVRFGANLEPAPPRNEVVRDRPHAAPRLLLVGVDWDRKGAPVALAALRELRREGVPAQLTICGCEPPEPVAAEGLRVIPFLDPNDPVQRKTLVTLFREADFFLLPTAADCTPIVAAEAASMGLPVLSTRIGGVEEMVHHGKTGRLFPAGTPGEAYAGIILDYLRNPARYHETSRAARELYERELNWDAWARRTVQIFQRVAAA